MNVDLFSRAGRLLYGERWMSPLARRRHVTFRSVHRWVSEDNVPDRMVAELLEDVRARQRELTEVEKELDALVLKGNQKIGQEDR